MKSIDTDLLSDKDLSTMSCTSTFELKTTQEIENEIQTTEESDESEEESHYKKLFLHEISYKGPHFYKNKDSSDEEDPDWLDQQYKKKNSWW